MLFPEVIYFTKMSQAYSQVYLSRECTQNICQVCSRHIHGVQRDTMGLMSDKPSTQVSS